MNIEERIKYAEQKQDEAFRNNSIQSLNYWEGYKTAMEHIGDKGYRKASEVALEVIDEIEKINKQYCTTIASAIIKAKLAELKKKYTED